LEVLPLAYKETPPRFGEKKRKFGYYTRKKRQKAELLARAGGYRGSRKKAMDKKGGVQRGGSGRFRGESNDDSSNGRDRRAPVVEGKNDGV